MVSYITARLISAVNYQRKATTRSLASLPLHVVIHRELVRVWPQTQRVVFLLFHVDPVGDEAFVEDVAAQQEGMIGLERFDCAAERIWDAGNLSKFFGREFVEIFVERIAGIDAALYSVDAGEQHCREGEIWICS